MTFAFFYRASLGGPDERREQKFATLVGDHFGMSPTNILLTLLFLFFFICVIVAWMWKGQGNIVHIPLISGAFIFLIASIEVGEYYFPKQKAIIASIVFVNCLLWIFVGKRFRFLYLFISGVLGIGVLVFFLLF